MYASSHKRPFIPSVGGIRLLCNVSIGRGPSQFCETSSKITDWVTDPLRWFCNILGKVCGKRGGGGILTSPLNYMQYVYRASEYVPCVRHPTSIIRCQFLITPGENSDV